MLVWFLKFMSLVQREMRYLVCDIHLQTSKEPRLRGSEDRSMSSWLFSYLKARAGDKAQNCSTLPSTQI